MNLEQKFREAVDIVFQRWTTLALAMDQGWGGRDSHAKGRQLQAEVIEYLANASRKKRPPSWENPGDVEDLSHFLYMRIDELFNTETDDGSCAEVAALCLRLFSTCHAGDGAFADQVLQTCRTQAPQDLSKSQGSQRIEYATEEDELLDKVDGMEIEDDSEDPEDSDIQAEDAEGILLPGSESTHNGKGYGTSKKDIEPVVDDDGFTAVVKGRRRPR
ncbi:tsr2 [Symbiodinium natans]|uniref:Tsr2 protein n=1 Tax=Symbiodinium natans TaxID=878477 RepID=A0A812KIU0_9DINO|nr:tsr2 [Symbiodinium natans]